MNGITKRFPGVLALDKVSIAVRVGTVHALMGENGAGKSTLMKVLSGLYQPDEGEIRLHGRPVRVGEARAALGLGIAMVHQELSPIPDMTVGENIFLQREPLHTFLRIVDRKTMNRKTDELFHRLDVRIDPRRKMRQLSVAEAQMVEIAKALSYDATLIIMDEPTSAITDQEVDNLFRVIRSFRKDGISFVYISHKMDEVFEIADEITVLRDGRLIGTNPVSEVDHDALVRMMVGREVSDYFPKEPTALGDEALSVRELTRDGEFTDISFSVCRGEIFGIAGLMGAGRTELAECIFGATSADSGEIRMHGQELAITSPSDAIQRGIALVTEDRKLKGLNLKASVRDNLTLVNLDEYLLFGGVVNKRREAADVGRMVASLSIRTPSAQQLVDFLSGGNQQKVVIGKWLLKNPEILIMDEPTRGIDVGAKTEIYKLMNSIVASGKAIIMISSELPELLGMCDRIMVMSQGRATAIYERREFDQEKILASAMKQHLRAPAEADDVVRTIEESP